MCQLDILHAFSIKVKYYHCPESTLHSKYSEKNVRELHWDKQNTRGVEYL